VPVIAVVGNKGGAGKTTLSVNLVAGLAKQTSCVLVDADPQGSASSWCAVASSGAIRAIPEVSQLDTLTRELFPEYNYIVIDCPPSVHSPQTESALRICDLALIPVQPSPVDLWASVHVERAIAQARETNPALQALLVINQLEPRTTLSRVVREALSEIALPVAGAAVRRRALYRNSALEGKSVFDMGRLGADAAAEFDELVQEVMRK
jgi:chromosome partitioning protein